MWFGRIFSCWILTGKNKWLMALDLEGLVTLRYISIKALTGHNRGLEPSVSIDWSSVMGSGKKNLVDLFLGRNVRWYCIMVRSWPGVNQSWPFWELSLRGRKVCGLTLVKPRIASFATSGKSVADPRVQTPGRSENQSYINIPSLECGRSFLMHFSGSFQYFL